MKKLIIFIIAFLPAFATLTPDWPQSHFPFNVISPTIISSYLSAFHQYQGETVEVPVGESIAFSAKAPNPIIGGNDITINEACDTITFLTSGSYCVSYGISTAQRCRTVPMLSEIFLEEGVLSYMGNTQMASTSFVIIVNQNDTLNILVLDDEAKLRADTADCVDAYITVLKLE